MPLNGPEGVWISDLGTDFYDFISVFSSVLFSSEKIYKTLKTVLNHISKHFDVRQESSTTRPIIDFLGVQK